MTDKEIWDIAEKWAKTLRAVANRNISGSFIDSCMGIPLTCTIRDAIREAIGKPPPFEPEDSK
jgi:hypothetical protein